jgi:hypothetical protein
MVREDMSKKTALLSAICVSFCVAAGGAQAKLIRYEINGQSYSYSTNNRQQTKEARERIAAAAAAEAAKTRAEAEAAANPLARIFGSQTQRAAAEAQARLQQRAPTEAQGDVASTSSVGRSGAKSRRSGTRASARRERRQAAREARLERQKTVRASRAQRVAARQIKPTPVVNGITAMPSVTSTSSLAPAPLKPVASAPAADSTPIPTSPPAVSSRPSASRDANGGSLLDFVNQVRRAPLDERAPRP